LDFKMRLDMTSAGERRPLRVRVSAGAIPWWIWFGSAASLLLVAAFLFPIVESGTRQRAVGWFLPAADAW